MKIVCDGKEYELTAQELAQAFAEQQHRIDQEDIEDYLDLDAFDDESLGDIYGFSREQLKEWIPDIAYLMRRYINQHDMSWECARPEAVEGFLRKKRKKLGVNA